MRPRGCRDGASGEAEFAVHREAMVGRSRPCASGPGDDPPFSERKPVLQGGVSEQKMRITYRYRVKDKDAARLKAQMRAVNMRNFANATQMRAVTGHRE